MAKKIAIISDLHFRNTLNECDPKRCGDLADVLLEKVVFRLNHFIRPDITLIVGDLLDSTDLPNTDDMLDTLNNSIKKLVSAVIVIPGNHDIPPDAFYQTLRRPGKIVELEGIKILPFVDREMPGYNAYRDPAILETFRNARSGFSGTIIAVQHVPLFPPEYQLSPYNYTNADQIIKVMEETGVAISISGHFHEGFAPVIKNGITFAAVPALCEKPFTFSIIEIDDDGTITFDKQQLCMQEGTNISDCHLHTRLAYCNENMKIPRAVQIGQQIGLHSIVFSEHSSHLYFSRHDKDARKDYLEGISSSRINDRTGDYFSLCEMYRNDFCFLGMEIDVDWLGMPIIQGDVLNQLEVKLGAVHYLGEIADQNKRESEFIALTHGLLRAGINILAHPFQIFRQHGLATPERLFEPLAWMLKENNVAAEINFHRDTPSLEFVKVCLRNGVKLSFGSDSHNLAMIGEFYPHIKLLRDAGYDGNFDDILFRPTRK
jgi:histidinol phosphatase-like PHP family hydrolase